MKKCPRCKQTKPLTEYNKNKARKDGLQCRCKQCDTEIGKQKYRANRQRSIDRCRNRKLELRAWFIDYKKTKICEKCGDERWYVLDFHHNGDKDTDVSAMVADGYSKSRILHEIAKCSVLCANCHREEHYLESPDSSVEVAETNDRGRGVFTLRPIKKGKKFEVSPVIYLTAADKEHIDKTQLYDYYFSWGDGIAIGCGYSSMYNHSYTPNAKYVKLLEKRLIEYVALRDIEKGEEVTVNYNLDPTSQSPLWFTPR